MKASGYLSVFLHPSSFIPHPSSSYMLISAVLFGVMGLFIKLASLTIPIFEVTFFRSFLAWQGKGAQPEA